MIRKALAGLLAVAATTIGLVAMSPGPAMASGGWHISNFGSRKCVVPANNNTTDRNVRLVLSALPCPAAVTWNFQESGGSITLDANSARCMVPSGSSTVKNAAVVSGACGPSAFFAWQALYVTTWGNLDYYQLKNVGSGYCLAVVGNSTATGASILQAPCNYQNGELFTW